MPKPKLTDTDRVILASAGARETGLVLPIPKSLKLSSTDLEPVLRRLLSKGLLLERPSPPNEKPWAGSEEGMRTSLIIAPQGLEAVGLGVDESGEEAAPERTRSRSKAGAGAKRASHPTRRASNPKSGPKAIEPAPEARTKLDILIGALRQRKGATITELMEATGWQAHSVRGSISGALKKRLSLNVTSKTVTGRGRVYRVEAETTK
jgi:hypothetical protein